SVCSSGLPKPDLRALGRASGGVGQVRPKLTLPQVEGKLPVQIEWSGAGINRIDAVAIFKRQRTNVQHNCAATEAHRGDRDRPWITPHPEDSTAADLAASSSHRGAQSKPHRPSGCPSRTPGHPVTVEEPGHLSARGDESRGKVSRKNRWA